MAPLAIDLFCGLGGWTEGLLAEGYRVVGFDIERHQYGTACYPAQLVLQDVLTLHGSQFRNAALIVASPPCQAYSYRAMPWKRAKALPTPDNTLFEACFRIQREAIEAAGRYIPLVVENVCGAQKWVGRARWHYGSFYLWGDVPALMPITKRAKVNGFRFDGRGGSFQTAAVNSMKTIETSCSDCPPYGYPTDKTRCAECPRHVTSDGQNPDGRLSGLASAPASVEARITANSAGSGQQHARSIKSKRASMPPCATCGHSWGDHAMPPDVDYDIDDGKRWCFALTESGECGCMNYVQSPIKNGGDWFGSGDDCSLQRRAGSKSTARKAASAHIAKIPLPLACWIARAWCPLGK